MKVEEEVIIEEEIIGEVEYEVIKTPIWKKYLPVVAGGALLCVTAVAAVLYTVMGRDKEELENDECIPSFQEYPDDDIVTETVSDEPSVE